MNWTESVVTKDGSDLALGLKTDVFKDDNFIDIERTEIVQYLKELEAVRAISVTLYFPDVLNCTIKDLRSRKNVRCKRENLDVVPPVFKKQQSDYIHDIMNIDVGNLEEAINETLNDKEETEIADMEDSPQQLQNPITKKICEEIVPTTLTASTSNENNIPLEMSNDFDFAISNPISNCNESVQTEPVKVSPVVKLKEKGVNTMTTYYKNKSIQCSPEVATLVTQTENPFVEVSAQTDEEEPTTIVVENECPCNTCFTEDEKKQLPHLDFVLLSLYSMVPLEFQTPDYITRIFY